MKKQVMLWLMTLALISTLMVGCSKKEPQEVATYDSETVEATEEETVEEEEEETSKYAGQECSFQNDRLGMKISFIIPDIEEGWTQSVADEAQEGYMYFYCYPNKPQGEADINKSWELIFKIDTWAADSNRERNLAAHEENDDDKIFDAENGISWFVRTDEYDNGEFEAKYDTFPGTYLEGVYYVSMEARPYGNRDKLTEIDRDYYDSLVSTILNTMKFETEYEGKPDLSDGIYSGNLAHKWPKEIPFEDGVITGKRKTYNASACPVFT